MSGGGGNPGTAINPTGGLPAGGPTAPSGASSLPAGYVPPYLRNSNPGYTNIDGKTVYGSGPNPMNEYPHNDSIYTGMPSSPTGQTPAGPPPVVPFGGGIQHPTMNLNNIAPGAPSIPSQQPMTGSLQSGTGGVMPAFPNSPQMPNINPLAALQSPQGIHPNGQPDGMSFNQAFAQAMQPNQNIQFMNFLHSLMGGNMQGQQGPPMLPRPPGQ